jgi:alpha-beta hydrolase superfamily lysophospholipase
MKNITLVFLITLFTFSAISQKINPLWSGNLDAGGQKIELILHLSENKDQSYSSSWDVPAQKAKGLVSSKTEFNNQHLYIEIKMIGASFTGDYNNNTIIGTWEQSGMKFPLQLEPLENEKPEVVIVRPQTPKPPFSYQVKEFVYTGEKTKLKYGATLTYPNDSAQFPLIILITGSGIQDRNETILDHKPFAVIADYLTKKGYAVLRVDDRGIGKSNGKFSQSTSEDFANDVEEHIHYAKTLSMIDTNKIGLCGHSEGGLIAPLVASRNKSVAFVMMMAGPGIDITEMMALQNEAVLKSNGVNEKAIKKYLPLYKDLLRSITQAADNTYALSKARSLTEKWVSSNDKEDVKATTNISNEKDIDDYVKIITSQLSSKWWKFFANYNPQPILEQLKCPVLAINGSSDIQVVSAQNLKGIKSSLKKAGNKNYTIKEFESLNHLFQKCNKCTVQEYGDLETTIEPEVLDFMAKWLDKNIK